MENVRHGFNFYLFIELFILVIEMFSKMIRNTPTHTMLTETMNSF